MDEDELYEAFGLEPEAGGEEDPTVTAEGVDTRGIAPQGQGKAPWGGAPGEESQDPEGGAGGENGEAVENPLGEQEGHPGGTGPRPEGAAVIPASSAEDARAAEQAKNAAVDQAYAAAFAGKKNPYNGQAITTKAEYEQYQEQYQADQQRQRLERMRAAGVDPAAIQAIVDQHPAIQKAQQVIQQAEAERVKAQEAQAKGWFGEQLKQINTLDPEVKVGSMDELCAKDPEKFNSMLGMVTRGVSLVDAYKMTHFDELTQRRTAAAQQTVRNQAAGKAHLTASGGQGKAGVEVPAGIREEFRALMPGITDEEIKRQYADYLDKTK